MEEHSLGERIRRLLALPLDTLEEREALLHLGLSPEDMDNGMGVAAALVRRALKNGDVSAVKEIRVLLDAAETPPLEKKFELPARMIAPSFFQVFYDILEGGHREYVLCGGRGSAKSTFVSLMVLYLLLQDDAMHALICRRVKDTIRDSVFAQMTWAIDQLGLEAVFECSTSPMEIRRKDTGQKILFRGTDMPEKLKSIQVPFGYIGILWFEELDQFDGAEQVRNVEQSVIRGGEKAYVFKTFNPPRTRNNWANRYLEQPKAGRLVHRSTYETVPRQWLGDAFLEEAAYLKEVDEAAYNHEYLGIANGTGGQVFDNVILRAVSPAEYDACDRIYMGVDWGWYPDPYAWVKVHYDAARRRLFLLDELVCTKRTNRETAALLLEEKGVTPQDRILADSAEPKSIGDYRQMGLLCRRAQKGPGSVELSTRWLQGLAEIVIDPERCPAAAKEFTDYAYETDREGNVISRYPDRNNHTIDAVRYALSEVWRRKGT